MSAPVIFIAFKRFAPTIHKVCIPSIACFVLLDNDRKLIAFGCKIQIRIRCIGVVIYYISLVKDPHVVNVGYAGGFGLRLILPGLSLGCGIGHGFRCPIGIGVGYRGLVLPAGSSGN